jgi:predicted transcriptional regulator
LIDSIVNQLDRMESAKLINYIDVLKVLFTNGPFSTNQLIFKTKLTDDELNKRIDFLLELRLIKKKVRRNNELLFFITQKGIRVLTFFKDLNLLVQYTEK